MKRELLFNKNIVHDSAYKHVSGLAEYTDDINEPLNTFMVLLVGVKKLMQ